MSEFRTDLQRQVISWVVVLSARKRENGAPMQVTTRELTEQMGRAGQVVGHSCGALAARGLLARVAPATYRLTRAGHVAVRAEFGNTPG